MGTNRAGKETGKIDISLIVYIIAIILAFFLLILLLDALHHYVSHGPFLPPLSWFIRQ